MGIGRLAACRFKLTSNQYCMPVLGLIFLRYAYSRYKMVEAEIFEKTVLLVADV